MHHLTFRWTRQGSLYEFRGRAENPRSQCDAVDAEIVDISRWIAAQSLPAGACTLTARRRHETVKDETLTFAHGKVQSTGGTGFRPAITDVVLRLPEEAALRFRLAFDITDRKR